jgi:hypothetical protein
MNKNWTPKIQVAVTEAGVVIQIELGGIDSAGNYSIQSPPQQPFSVMLLSKMREFPNPTYQSHSRMTYTSIRPTSPWARMLGGEHAAFSCGNEGI